MKNLKYYWCALVIAMVVSACEKDPSFLFEDENAFFAFEAESFKITESAESVLKIPVYVARSTPDGTVPFTIDVEGIENPAIEGVDFEIVNVEKQLHFESEATEYIQILAIDNTEEDGLKRFRIKLEEQGASYNVGMSGGDGTIVEVSIGDDEHPLNLFFGAFHLKETTIETGNPEYEYDVTLSGHEDSDKAILTGLWNEPTQDLVLQFNYENNTVKIVRDQQLYAITYGSYVLNFYVLGWDWQSQADGIVNLYPEVEGTFNIEEGVIEFPGGYALQVSYPAEVAGAMIPEGIQDYCVMNKKE